VLRDPRGRHPPARAILDRSRDVLEDGARELLARESLESAAVEALARRLRPAAPSARAA
jgi:ATP-dependent Zn protease